MSPCPFPTDVYLDYLTQVVMRPFALLVAFIVLGYPVAAQELVWEPAVGPMGGTLWTFPLGDGLVLATSDHPKGAWRSTDGGQTWALVHIPRNGFNTPRAVIRTSTGRIVGYDEGEMYISDDDGLTWRIRPSLHGLSVWNSVALPDRIVSLNTSGSVETSFDDGETWSDTGNAGVEYGDLVVGPRGALWATGDGGAFRSWDYGQTWYPLHPDVTPNYIRDVEALVATATDLYALTYSGVFVLVEGTVSRTYWKRVSHGNFNGRSLAVAEGGRALFVGGERAVWRSLDGGDSWERIRVGNDTVYGLSIPSPGTVLATVRDQGVWTSTDGGKEWALTGVPSCEVTNFDLSGDRPRLLAGCERGRGIFESHDGGVQWHLLATHPGHITLAVAATGAGSLFTAAGPGAGTGTFRSVDEGTTWTEVFDDPAIFAHGPGDDFYAFFYDSWQRTSDGGETWEEGPLPGPFGAAAVMPNGRLLSSVDRTVYHSDDGGFTWEPAAQPLPLSIETLVVGTDGVVYAPVDYYGVYRSADGGEHWRGVPFERDNVRDIPFAAGPPGIAVYAEENEVYYTLDGGITWTWGGEAVPRGDWPFADVTTLAVTPEGRVLAGTDGKSVYTAILPTTTSGEEDVESASQSIAPALAVYPNPVGSGPP